jgi:predicted alpha/beta-fold hydrolase
MYEEVTTAKYLYQIDQAVHARLLSFQNYIDLYNAFYTRGNIKHIKVPTLFISADDDQIFEQKEKVPIYEA